MLTQYLQQKIDEIQSLIGSYSATAPTANKHRQMIAQKIQELRDLELGILVAELSHNAATSGMVAGVKSRHATILGALATFMTTGSGTNATAVGTALGTHETAMAGTVYPAVIANMPDANVHDVFLTNLNA